MNETIENPAPSEDGNEMVALFRAKLPQIKELHEVLIAHEIPAQVMRPAGDHGNT